MGSVKAPKDVERQFLICATFANNGSLLRSTTKMMARSPNPTSRISRLLDLFQYRSDFRVLIRLLGITLVVAYVLFLVRFGTSYASSSDASGYFNTAKLFTEFRISDTVRTLNDLNPPEWDYYFQQPLGFKAVGGDGHMVPTYPIGLSLLLLGAQTLVGWDHAATVINVLCALGCGWLLIRLGREHCGLRIGWAVLATVLLWLCPLFVFFALQPMSDVPATFWTLLAIHCAAMTLKKPTWGWLAGAAVGMAVLVRPTNVLLILPVLILMGFGWRKWVACFCGGLPFAIVLISYNKAVYGNPFTSGYGDVSTLFSIGFLKHNLAHFALWIPQLQTPLILLALFFPVLVRENKRMVFALSTWSALLVGLYAFYYHSGETWWYLRFILPTFPCLILLALMVAQRMANRWKSVNGQTLTLSIVMILAALQLTFTNRQLHVMLIRDAEAAYYQTIKWLETNVPDSAVMAAMQMSGTLHFYTKHPLLRYDLIPREKFIDAVAAAQAEGRNIYAPLFPFELERVIEAKLGGEWEQVGTVEHITIWRLKL